MLFTGTAIPPAGMRCISEFLSAISRALPVPAQEEISHKSLVDFNFAMEVEGDEGVEGRSLRRKVSPKSESRKLTLITIDVTGRNTLPFIFSMPPPSLICCKQSAAALRT